MKGDILKTVVWVGSSLEDLKIFPWEVKSEVGFILDRVQRGESHRNVRPLRGFDGVWEIVTSYMGDAYRTVYALKIGEVIDVLHAFQKKSKRGLKLPELK